MIFKGPTNNFFKDPGQEPYDEGDCILYHLRVGLVNLYGSEADFTTDADQNTLLATIGMLSGLDYLSKVYCQQKKSTRTTFKTLVKDLCSLSEDDAEALYQLRCALVHNFSLQVQRVIKAVPKELYKFILNDKPLPNFLKETYRSPTLVEYKVSFWGLKNCFVHVFKELERICSNGSHPKHREVYQAVVKASEEKLMKL